MKKVLFLAITLIPLAGFASQENSQKYSAYLCLKRIQPAISVQGECKEFSNSCDVPSDWKKVSSCKNFAAKESVGKPIEEVMYRKFSNMWEKFKEKKASLHTKYKNKEEKKTNSQKSLLRESSKDFSFSGGREVKKSNLELKTSTQKNWNSPYRKVVSPLRKKLLERKDRLQKIRSQAQKARNNRQIVGSSTKMIREGSLSNKFWSTQVNSRKNRKAKFLDRESVINSLRSRQPFLRKDDR